MDVDTALRDEIRQLPDPSPIADGAAIRVASRRASSARAALWAAAALLVLGGGVLAVVAATRPDDDPLGPGRWRGAGGTASVELGAVLDGEAGIAVTGPVGLDRAVVFHVTTDTAGYLCLDESGPDGWTRVHPGASEAWSVDPGSSWPGGDAPLAFRTDHGPGERTYRALLDPEDPACGDPVAEDHVTIHWSTAP